MTTQTEISQPGIVPRSQPARPPHPDVATTVVETRKGWQLVNLRELWQYRALLYFLVWRDVKVRYKQTALGALWAVLQPAAMMVVFTLVFGRLAKLPTGEIPYPLFAYCGLLPWTFFAASIASAGSSVVASERLITKVYFPRLAIPLAAVGTAVVDLAIACSLLVVLMLWFGAGFSASMLLAPLCLLPIMIFAVGVGSLLAALTVMYRDFRHVVPIMVQVWLFATPTVYMQLPAGGPTFVHWLAMLNPMTSLVAGFRAAVLGGEMPWLGLALSTSLAILTVAAGCLYFRRVEDSFADTI